jgi:tetratricopeptide (TPR) repeat protein
VSTPAQREARAALDVARAAVARLDSSRGPEDQAADLIDTWSAVEGAVRSLVGSTVLAGQPLIRDARQRQLISFDTANSLAEFQAVYDRVQNTSYHPTESDVAAAKSAFQKLDDALKRDATLEFSAPRTTPASAAAMASQHASSSTQGPAASAAANGPAGLPRVGPPPRRVPWWAVAAFAAGIITVIVIVLVTRGGGSTASLQQGQEAYSRGQREVAVNAFNKAARENPKLALPHIYLARMAREVGNFTLASQELQLALEAEPSNALALREMGANLLTQGNYELARRFYVRAVQADPADKNAQGYLGCTLMRLNRTSEATNFLNRAGPGPWSNCTPAQPTTSANIARP